jgi:hypothetical protein
MEPSVAGVLVCCGLLAAAWFTEAPVIVALMASLAFGSTAIVTLTALGGSSPLIYVVFLMGLFLTVALRRNVLRELGTVFTQQPLAWLILLLTLYTVVGALVLPRMFAGQTTAFIPLRTVGAGRIAEIPLAPVTGNITQSLYFVLTALSFFAFSVLLLKREAFGAIRTGFFAWASLHASLGFIDLFGKIAGLGDLLAPVRSASYAMLTQVDVAGFWRIAGGYSEASAFGAMTVSLLAFTFTYWRSTQDRFALALSVALLALLILSTSSTAYVASAILLVFVLASITGAALRDRLRKQDVLLLVGALVALGVVIGIVLNNERVLDPFWRLLDTMVINKASSSSGEERAYWNYRSLQSVIDTAGLGIGIGSSRASSWIIAVMSQLGIVGTLMMGFLTVEIIRGVGSRGADQHDREVRAIANSARAACLAGLVTASISSGDADPGLRFYIALAVILSCRRLVRQRLYDPTRGGRFSFPAVSAKRFREPGPGGVPSTSGTS